MAERGVAFTASTGMRLTTGAFIHTNGAEAMVSLGRLLEVLGTLDDLPPEIEYDGHVHTLDGPGLGADPAGSTRRRRWTSIESVSKGLVGWPTPATGRSSSATGPSSDCSSATSTPRSSAIDEALGRDGTTGGRRRCSTCPSCCQLGVRAEVDRLLDPLRSPDDADPGPLAPPRPSSWPSGPRRSPVARESSMPATARRRPRRGRARPGRRHRPTSVSGRGPRRSPRRTAGRTRGTAPTRSWRLAEAIPRPEPDRTQAAATDAARAGLDQATAIAAAGLVAEVRALARRGPPRRRAVAPGRAERRAGTAGDEPSTPTPSTEANPFERLGLTPREADVLTLLADGRTNREIAGRAVHQPEDGERPREQHPRQARGAHPHPGGGRRPSRPRQRLTLGP